MRKLLAVIIIAISPMCFAEEFNLPKEQWLTNLEGILPAHLCKPESPLMKVYTGNNCLSDMKVLYGKCTTEVDNVVIPSHVTSVPMANTLGQIVAECMSAHYQGGQALEMFNLIQSMSRR